VAKREAAAEVVVIDERITVTHPTMGVNYYTAIVTFRKGDELPRTVFIPFSDVAKGKEEDLNKQYLDKKGDLYKAYLTYRAKKIKEDLEKIGAFKPETVRF
jgi:hypothetical protein